MIVNKAIIVNNRVDTVMKSVQKVNFFLIKSIYAKSNIAGKNAFYVTKSVKTRVMTMMILLKKELVEREENYLKNQFIYANKSINVSKYVEILEFVNSTIRTK